MNYQSIREECCEANRALPRTGLVDLTFGNVSVLDPDAGVFAIKPSGVPYDELLPEHMVIVDLEGRTVEGDLRFSSDTPTHRKLFLAFPGVRSVVHTHSRHAVSFAQAGRENSLPRHDARRLFLRRGASHARDDARGNRHGYEWNTGVVIAERFAGLNALDIPAVPRAQPRAVCVWAKRCESRGDRAGLRDRRPMARDAIALNPTVRVDPAGAPRQAFPPQARRRRLLRPAEKIARHLPPHRKELYETPSPRH